MNYSYYPGCTLKTKAQNLEKFALHSAQALGVNLVEQEEWQCCGAVYPLSTDEIATKLASVRSLAAARDKGESLVTLCAACHQLMKRVNHDMQTKEDMREKVNNYLQLDDNYQGESKVIHYLELLRDEIGFETLAQKVKVPLKGRKVAAYYGCLLLRPKEIMNFDDPERPTVLEDFLESLGASAIHYPYKTECCGGYLSVDKEEVVEQMVDNIIRSALEQGAEEIVTACPLCKYNLENSRLCSKGEISISYFTELLAEALDVKEA
ncbi:MAG: CoB--CoM heterodisulfide reductase iron-sulfur subunit B family protein [Firmicutes bacterium]|nr:CoB--CoM heterodisulfide reductase iron-sulfur subunit B family protein [Bacillota bacterium]